MLSGAGIMLTTAAIVVSTLGLSLYGLSNAVDALARRAIREMLDD